MSNTGGTYSCSFCTAVFRIVQDGVAFPSVMQRVTQWEEVNGSRKRKLTDDLQKVTDDLLGVLIAEVAPRKMHEAKGGKFEVGRADLLGEWQHLHSFFGSVQGKHLKDSEPLNDFAKSFGYNFQTVKVFANGSWHSIVFTPA